MVFAVGLRFYKIAVHKKGEKTQLEIGPNGEPCDLIDYVSGFVERKREPTDEGGAQRTWSFDPVATESIRTVHGYISYGTHGFESNFKDRKTKQQKYSRKASDLEEVPLYFQFWVPSDAKYALVAFQSFQGRSCVSFIRSSMLVDFPEKFPGYSLTFSVVAPAAAIAPAAPVKGLTFTKPKYTSDRADQSWFGKAMEEVSYELTVRAKQRGRMLSTFQELSAVLEANEDGTVQFDGTAFEGVRADVKIGNRRRVVGIFGSGGDAGLIDVTENIKSDKSGHPIFASIVSEVDSLMESFFEGIKT